MDKQEEITQKDKDYLKQLSEDKKVSAKDRRAAKILLEEIDRMEREWAFHQKAIKEYQQTQKKKPLNIGKNTESKAIEQKRSISPRQKIFYQW